MKMIHLSDLHIGKRLNDYSLIEDQKYILKSILKVIDEESPAAVLIAGDVYDKSVPSAEAVEVFDDFLVSLSKRDLDVFIISGNHDSPERLSFGNRLMDKSGIHIAPVYDGHVSSFTTSDDFGEVCIFMLPFIKPANVRRFYPDAEIESYTDAVKTALSDCDIDESKRNVLITHQFVTGADRTESEEISVGGSDNVDASVFSDFDYVALGHIHRGQKIESDKIRYSGTPLKYSFSESKDEKNITVIELGEKGELELRFISLKPLHDMVEIKGSYDEIMLKSFYENTSLTEDYLHITLTDEEDVLDAIGRLRSVYKNLMKLDYDNKRTRTSSEISTDNDIERKTPLELFSDFYELQNNSPLSKEQEEILTSMIEKIWEADR